MVQNKSLQLIKRLPHPRSFQSNLTENTVKVRLETLFPHFSDPILLCQSFLNV